MVGYYDGPTYCEECNKDNDYFCFYCSKPMCVDQNCAGGGWALLPNSTSGECCCAECNPDLHKRAFSDSTLLNNLLEMVNMTKGALIAKVREGQLAKQESVNQNMSASIANVLKELESNLKSDTSVSRPKRIPIDVKAKSNQFSLKSLFPSVKDDASNDDIIINIFNFCDFEDLLQCLRVSKQWGGLESLLISKSDFTSDFKRRYEYGQSMAFEKISDILEAKNEKEWAKRIDSPSQASQAMWIGVLQLIRCAGIAYEESGCYDLVLQRIIDYLREFLEPLSACRTVLTVSDICERISEMAEDSKRNHPLFAVLYTLQNEWGTTESDSEESGDEIGNENTNNSADKAVPFDFDNAKLDNDVDLRAQKLQTRSKTAELLQIRFAQRLCDGCMFSGIFYQLVHHLFPSSQFTEAALHTLQLNTEAMIVLWLEIALLVTISDDASRVVTVECLNFVSKLFGRKPDDLEEQQKMEIDQEPQTKRVKSNEEIKTLTSLYHMGDRITHKLEQTIIATPFTGCDSCGTEDDETRKAILALFKQGNCIAVQSDILHILHRLINVINTEVNPTNQIGGVLPLDRLAECFLLKNAKTAYLAFYPMYTTEDEKGGAAQDDEVMPELSEMFEDDDECNDNENDVDDDEVQALANEDELPEDVQAELVGIPCIRFMEEEADLPEDKHKSIQIFYQFIRGILGAIARHARAVMDYEGARVLTERHLKVALVLLGVGHSLL